MADGTDEAGLLAAIAGIVGPANLLIGARAEAFHTDIYEVGTAPIAVVRPADVEALQAVVRLAGQNDIAIFPRGGGASYTSGYLPNRTRSLVIDLGGLDRIVEINEADAYVTVEAGVTWAKLKAALDPMDLRTPFFGPFSGWAATVGGSVSQNAISHGSGAHGISAQSVQSLDVVLATGEILSTGSAMRGSPPFARFYGPDLAGLFTGDCGALGIKARITLPLLKRKAAFGCASYAFQDMATLAEAMRRASMEGLDDEHFAIDRALSQGQIARNEKVGAIVPMAKAVFASAPSPIAGLLTLIRMAGAGTRALRSADFMLHFMVEGARKAEVDGKLKRLRAIMGPGLEIPNSTPTVVRAMPFAPLTNVLGPGGERWVPIHGILPNSKVDEFHTALVALYAGRADEMTRLGVWNGGMFQAVGPSAFLYEVALYWPGVWNAYHAGAVPPETLASAPRHDDSPEATALVARLKHDIIALLDQFGATFFQLGRAYPYAERLSARPLSLLRAVKRELDPKNLMNPGVLGL